MRCFKNRFIKWLTLMAAFVLIVTAAAGCGKKTAQQTEPSAPAGTVQETESSVPEAADPEESSLPGSTEAAGDDFSDDHGDDYGEDFGDDANTEPYPGTYSDEDEGLTLYEEGPAPHGTISGANDDSGRDDYDSGEEETAANEAVSPVTVERDGTYTSKEEVALYIHTYGRLPSNFISKRKAEDRGWVASKGNLDKVCPGKSIGGSRYNNYEHNLPDGNYRECDINYTGGYRGAERLVYSDDGRVYYTADNYKTFEQLY